MRCSSISSILNTTPKKVNFRESEKNKKNSDFTNDKKINLDTDIEGLSGLSLIALLCSLPLYGFASGLEKGKKMTTKEKWGAGLILLGLAFSVIADFKRIKFYKEVKRENK